MHRTRAALVLACTSWLAATVATGQDLAGKELSGRDFSGQRLLEADFRGSTRRNARFRGAVLRGARFDAAHLDNADFRQADVRGASFVGAKGLTADPNAFRNAIFSEATVWPAGASSPPRGVQLVSSRDASTPPGGQSLPAATPPTARTPPAAPSASAASPALETSVDSGVSFRGKNLSRKDFSNQYLNGANFEATDLTFTSFYQARLQRAIFRAADVIQTNFNGADLTRADFSRAVIDRASFVSARLNCANPEGQTLHLAGSPVFFKMPDREIGYEEREMLKLAMSGHLHNYNLILKGANLRNATVFGNLATVDLRKTDLRGADLSGCENAEPRFFAGAVYDGRTQFPPDIDPARAGSIRGDDIPPPIANATRISSAAPQVLPPSACAQPPLQADASPSPRPAAASPTAPTRPSSSGMAGFFWRLEGTRGSTTLLHLYPEGAYAWSAAEGKTTENRWEPATVGDAAIRLLGGPGGEDWTATSPKSDRIVLKSNRTGLIVEGSRGDSID